MDNVQFLTVLGAILGCFVFLYREMKDGRKEIKEELEDLKKDFQQLNTRVAVIESKLTDINTNVSHLMWHTQSMPNKDVLEE